MLAHLCNVRRWVSSPLVGKPCQVLPNDSRVANLLDFSGFNIRINLSYFGSGSYGFINLSNFISWVIDSD